MLEQNNAQQKLPQKIALLKQKMANCEQSRLLALNKLKENLLEPGGLVKKIDMITAQLVDIFDADCARMWMIKPGDLCDEGCLHANNQDAKHLCKHKDKCLHLISSAGAYSDIDNSTHKRVPFDCYKIGEIASGEDLKFVTNDVVNDLRIHDHQWAKERNLVSFAGHRIILQGKTVGVFALLSKYEINLNMEAILEDIANAAGQVIYIAEIENSLSSQNKFLKNIIESLVHPFYVINTADYSIALANSYADNEGLATASKCYALTHQRDKPCSGKEHGCPMTQVVKTKKPAIVEHVHYDQYNNPKTVEVRCCPIFDDTGNIKQVIEYSVDISERKKIELKLKQSANDWHRTFDSINDLIFIQDLNNVIVRVNKAFADYLGLKHGQIEGRKCYELWHEKDSPLRNCPMELTKKDQKLHAVEIYDTRFEKPLRITTSPIFDSNNQMVGIVHVSRDISEEKQSAKELRRKMHDLEIFRKSAVGREIKMMEMKKTIQCLEKKINSNNQS